MRAVRRLSGPWLLASIGTSIAAFWLVSGARADKDTFGERLKKRRAALKQMNRERGWRKDVKPPLAGPAGR